MCVRVPLYILTCMFIALSGCTSFQDERSVGSAVMPGRPSRHTVSGHNLLDGRLTTLARQQPSLEAQGELVVRSSGESGGGEEV